MYVFIDYAMKDDFKSTDEVNNGIVSYNSRRNMQELLLWIEGVVKTKKSH